MNAATQQQTGMFGLHEEPFSPSNHEFAKPRDRQINAFAKPTVVGCSGIKLCDARNDRVITLTGERNKGPPSREMSNKTPTASDKQLSEAADRLIGDFIRIGA
jgi:hypothetical protein